MGLTNSKNMQFVNTIDGKFRIRCEKETEGAVHRLNKNQQDVYELTFNELSGQIAGISFRDNDFGTTEISVIIKDDKDYCLNMPLSSGTAMSFMMALPNINFAHPLKLVIWSKVVDDKRKTRIYLKQDGENIEWYFTKECPNGLPAMTQIKVKGTMVWDDSERIEFLKDYIENKIIPQIKKTTSHQDDVSKNEPSPDALPIGGYKDDLPF